MQDSEQEYPLKQPQRGHHAFDDFQADKQDDDGNHAGNDDDDRGIRGPTGTAPLAASPGRSRASRRSRNVSNVLGRPSLPRAIVQKTLLVALVAGILATLQGVIFTLANSSLYHQAGQFSNDPSKLPIGVATSILGLFCLTSFLSFVIYFAAGFVTGMMVVDRKMGFLGGFVAGIFAYLLGYLIHLFPGYPDATSGSLNGGVVGIGGGIIAGIIIVVLLALISGLAGLLGAWLATRNHAYYYYNREE